MLVVRGCGARPANGRANTTLTFPDTQVLAKDSGGAGGLFILSNTDPASGSLTYDYTNFAYTPNTDFTGQDSFQYVVSDSAGDTATGTVSINVVAAATLPQAGFAAPTDAGPSDGTYVATINLSAAAALDVTIPVTVSGTAVEGQDFDISDLPVTIAAGTTSAAVTIDGLLSIADGGQSTVVLTLGTPVNAALGPNTTYTLTLADATPQ